MSKKNPDHENLTAAERRSLLEEERAGLSSLLTGLRERQRSHPENAARVVKILDTLVAINHLPMTRHARLPLHGQLNALLVPYKWTAQITAMFEGSSRPRYVPEPIRTSDAGLQWERDFIEAILFEIQESRVVAYLDRCESCQRFLVAKTAKGKRFCDARCKQKNFDSLPDNRERKRETMRKNYETKKTSEARAEAMALQGRSAVKHRATR